MKRLAIVIGATAAATVMLAAPASADASVCASIDVSINGQGTAQAICLPPAS